MIIVFCLIVAAGCALPRRRPRCIAGVCTPQRTQPFALPFTQTPAAQTSTPILPQPEDLAPPALPLPPPPTGTTSPDAAMEYSTAGAGLDWSEAIEAVEADPEYPEYPESPESKPDRPDTHPLWQPGQAADIAGSGDIGSAADVAGSAIDAAATAISGDAAGVDWMQILGTAASWILPLLLGGAGAATGVGGAYGIYWIAAKAIVGILKARKKKQATPGETDPGTWPRDASEAIDFVRLSEEEGRSPIADCLIGRLAQDRLDEISRGASAEQSRWAKDLKAELLESFNRMMPPATKGVV